MMQARQQRKQLFFKPTQHESNPNNVLPAKSQHTVSIQTLFQMDDNVPPKFSEMGSPIT